MNKKFIHFGPENGPKIGTNPAKTLQNKEKQVISEEIDLFSLAAGEGFESADRFFINLSSPVFTCICLLLWKKAPAIIPVNTAQKSTGCYPVKV